MHWKQMAKSNLAYLVGSVANTGVLLLLVPYLVNKLTTNEFGAWSLYEIMTLVLITIISLGLDTGLMRQYWYLKDETERARLVGSTLVAVLLWSVVLMCLTSLMILSIATPVEGIFDRKDLLILVIATGSFEGILAIFLALFRIQEQPIAFVSLSVTRMIVFCLAVVAFVESGEGIDGAVKGRLIAGLVAVVIAFVMSRQYVNFKFHPDLFRKTVRYGLPLLPYNIAMYIMFAGDRYVLERIMSLEQVAIYTFAYKIATVLDIIITRPFATDWAARRFKFYEMPNAKTLYSTTLTVYLFIAVSFSLLLLSGTRLVYEWFAPHVYLSGMVAVPILLAANVAAGMEGPVNIGIMVKDKTFYVPLIGFLGASITIITNLILIPSFGLVGAAISTVLSYSGTTMAFWLISRRFYHVDYSIAQGLVIILGAILGITWIQFIDNSTLGIYPGIFAKLVVNIIIIGGIFLVLKPALFKFSNSISAVVE